MDNLTEIGSTGLRRWGGHIHEERLNELKGTRWIRTILEMENDPVVGAILFSIEMLIRQVEWTVEPFEETSSDVEVAEFVNSCLHDMNTSWTDTLAEILTMLPYGWSYFEVVHKIRNGPDAKGHHRSKYTDGRIGWRKWGSRAQETLWKWEFDEGGGINGLWQLAPPNFKTVYIPIEKALLFRTSVRKGSPEGRSILRTAYRPWYFMRKIQNHEGVGIERDLTGLPVGYVPSDLLSSDAPPEKVATRNAMLETLMRIKRDEQEGLLWPGDRDDSGNRITELTLLSSGGSRQHDTDSIIRRYEQRIAMSVLADFIMLGHERVGTNSLSRDKTNMFVTAIGAWLDNIADTINRHAIPRLLEVNGMDLTRCPSLAHGEVSKVSIEELGDYVSKLSGTGAITFDNEMERHLRQQADMPPLADTEERDRTQQAQTVTANEEMAMVEAAQRIMAREQW